MTPGDLPENERPEDDGRPEGSEHLERSDLPAPRARGSRPAAALLLALLVLFGIVLARTSWLCDDAYITFRTVENVLAGRGAVWNAGERVQAYTHPLWMLLVCALRGASGELLVTVQVASIALSLAAAAVLARALGGGGAGALAVLLLVLSRAFVDYSTSGLENPLTHLLLALSVAELARSGTSRVLPLALCVGLAATNRMDTVLVLGPALAAALARQRSLGALGRAGLGLAPFAAWVAFALVYYGFAFPNSAYAKLGTGIPAGELAGAGLAYLANSLRLDPLTLVVVAVGGVLGLAGGAPGARLRGAPARALGVGIALHLVYVVRIGGDFMSGRMLTLPFLAAVALVADGLRAAPRALRVAVPLAAGVLAFATPRPTLLSGAGYGQDVRAVETGDRAGIVEERRYYHRATGLLGSERRGEVPANAWALRGLEARAEGPAVVTRRTIGFFGYFAGPEVVVVDLHALADPLLARIPRIRRGPGGRWRPGHFLRAVPEGYLETLRDPDGPCRIEHPELASYYEDLRRVVRGPLFAPERWRALARFHLGRNEPLVRSYVATLPRRGAGD